MRLLAMKVIWKFLNYPLPKIYDVLNKLRDCKFFSKIDLTSAYNQIELDDESKKLVTWSTHLGNLVMNRLPYGIKPANGIFQREMEKVLGDENGVVCFLDDIVISAPDLVSHNKRLAKVFQKLLEAGLRLNKEKCIFLKNRIEYLGHVVSDEGIFKINNNETIKKFPKPKNISDVRSFCGFVNYFGRFIPNLSTKLSPIYELRKTESPFVWTKEADKAFDAVKQEIMCIWCILILISL